MLFCYNLCAEMVAAIMKLPSASLGYLLYKEA